MKFLPWLYADKNGKNCKIKGLRVFCFFNDKADQIEMLNEWIKGLTEARDKIAETYKPPKASDILKEVLDKHKPPTAKEMIEEMSKKQPEEIKKATQSVYMAINAERRRAGTRMTDKVEKHFRQYKILSQREALTLYRCKALSAMVSFLRKEKGMKIINRMQHNGLFKERVYIYQENK